MKLMSNIFLNILLPLKEGWLWVNNPKEQLIRYAKYASIQYSRLPILDQTRQTHLRLLSKYAPWILQAAYGQIYSRPISVSSLISKSDIEQLIDVNSSVKLCCSSKPVVSVIIPIYGKSEYTLQCIASIALNPPQVAYEVIVVDDCSPDNSVEILKNIGGIRLLVNSENQGFIRSCNVGAQSAAGQFLCFLNNDTEVTRGWLDELFKTFSEFPGTGLSGSKLIYPDGTLQEAGGIIWQDGTGCNFGRNNDQWRPAYNYAREVDYCSGASIMVPRKLFEELGGFDEHYLPAYCEDSDLALKIRKSGYRVIYQPLSVVIHYEGVTSGTDTTQGTKAYQVENSRKLFERWNKHLQVHQSPGMDIDNAKDRMAKHRVLILDHCTPTPDQDAGSVTVYNLMLLLREMNFQVTFIPESNFLYVPGYTSALQGAGIEVLYAPYCTSVSKHLKVAGNRYDLVFMFRPTVVERHIKSVRKYCVRAKVLFHTVDLHFLRMSREAELLDSPVKKKTAAEMKQRELAAIRAVDSSIVHSTTELELLRLELPLERIHVFPLIIDIQGTEKGFNDRRDLIFLGGYKHTPNVDAVKYFVNDVMPFIRQRLPGVCFYAVGSHPPAEIFALQAEDVIVTGFVEDLHPLLDEMRISIAPLRYGAGIKGKIGTAMAAGLPVIATSLAAEGMSLSAGQNILVADGAEAFAGAVVQLYGDENLWGKLSRNGLVFAEKVWGAESAWDTLNRILLDLEISSVRRKYPLRLYSQKSNQKLQPVGVCRSRAEFEQLLHSDIFKEIASLENRLITQSGGREFFTVNGFCAPCRKIVSFHVDMTAGGYRNGEQWLPNWRERLVCPICHMNNRQRLIATLVEQHMKIRSSPGSNIYFMEQVTPIYKWAKGTFSEYNIIGSEFLGQDCCPGKIVRKIRHEDITNLSFEDNSINLIVSNDVFEHVFDPSLAFFECVRVLEPGGIMLATIPFHSNIDVSVTRSILGSDGLKHLLTPMYHGNPVSTDGSLVFTDFGWDLLETLKNSGFKDVTCELFLSQEFCHLGGGQIVFRAVKGGKSDSA